MKIRDTGIFFSSTPTHAPIAPAPAKTGSDVNSDSPRLNCQLTPPPIGGEDKVSSRRIEYLQKQLKLNSRRDLQLWIIVLGVMVVLAVGLAGILTPSLAWKTMSFHLDFKYLPQLFWGMIVLVALFSIYATEQKREVNATRTALIQELIISEHLQAFSFLDPVTQLLNSCAIDGTVQREIARANRQTPDALAGGRKNRVRERGRDGRNAGFADARWILLAWDDVNFNLRRLEHSQHLIVVEIGLLHAAVFQSDFGF